MPGEGPAAGPGRVLLRPGDRAGSLLAAAGPNPPRELGYPSPGTRRGLDARPGRAPGGGDFPSSGCRAFPPAPRWPAGRGHLAAVSRRPDALVGSSASPFVSCRRLRPRWVASPGPSGAAGTLGRAGARGSGAGRESHGVRYQSRGQGSRR